MKKEIVSEKAVSEKVDSKNKKDLLHKLYNSNNKCSKSYGLNYNS